MKKILLGLVAAVGLFFPVGMANATDYSRVEVRVVRQFVVVEHAHVSRVELRALERQAFRRQRRQRALAFLFPLRFRAVRELTH